MIIVDLTDDYETTIYAAARMAIEDGANPADTIATYRKGVLSMSGIVGELAKLTVRENKNRVPTLQLEQWKPNKRFLKSPSGDR